MKKIPNPERQLAYLAYVNRENDFRHHGYDEEMKQYLMMQAGDPGAVEESRRMMRRDTATALSADPLRNMQYLFVANITLTTRFAIEGGAFETVYRTLTHNRTDYMIVHATGEQVVTADGATLAYMWYTDEGTYTTESDSKTCSLSAAMERTVR